MRLDLRRIALAVLASAGMAIASAQAEAPDGPAVPKSRAEITYSFAPVVKKAQPAVVNVFASRIEQMPPNPFLDDPIFRRFFGEGGGMPRAVEHRAIARLRRDRRSERPRRHQ